MAHEQNYLRAFEDSLKTEHSDEEIRLGVAHYDELFKQLYTEPGLVDNSRRQGQQVATERSIVRREAAKRGLLDWTQVVG